MPHGMPMATMPAPCGPCGPAGCGQYGLAGSVSAPCGQAPCGAGMMMRQQPRLGRGGDRKGGNGDRKMAQLDPPIDSFGSWINGRHCWSMGSIYRKLPLQVTISNREKFSSMGKEANVAMRCGVSTTAWEAAKRRAVIHQGCETHSCSHGQVGITTPSPWEFVNVLGHFGSLCEDAHQGGRRDMALFQLAEINPVQFDQWLLHVNTMCSVCVCVCHIACTHAFENAVDTLALA